LIDARAHKKIYLNPFSSLGIMVWWGFVELPGLQAPKEYAPLAARCFVAVAVWPLLSSKPPLPSPKSPSSSNASA